MHRIVATSAVAIAIAIIACGRDTAEGQNEAVESLKACTELGARGLMKVPDDRADRFTGQVSAEAARCRGGEAAVAATQEPKVPWVDWPHYWATGDERSRNTRYDAGRLRIMLGNLFSKVHLEPNLRGIDGALIDLEYERVELIKFNLFDNYTYETYVKGLGGVPGSAVRQWDEMRLPPDHPSYLAVGGERAQACEGDLVRHRTLSGICNDTQNPLMGATGTHFARNVQFEETWPDLGKNELTLNRHGGRIGLLKPDPQLISRKLFTRSQSHPEACNDGLGLPGHSPAAQCDYQAAPFFNVLAAFWIQFMTHDWFSHMNEGENDRRAPLVATGCSDPEAQPLGCRPGDKVEPSLVSDRAEPGAFEHSGKSFQKRAHKTFANNVTAWWDASQIYGYDERSLTRVKRDPEDRAKLQMLAIAERGAAGDANAYLPVFGPSCRANPAAEKCDDIHPAWTGQEAAAFADNWTIGLSFYHNVFSREHNLFVEEFRQQATKTPDADSGLRRPGTELVVVRYQDVTDDELFEAARLVVSAEIAKVHTIEWTTQLLYDEPLYRAMNSNWNGLFDENEAVEVALSKAVERLKDSNDPKGTNSWYSVLAAGPGIFGLGSTHYESGSVFQTLKGLVGMRQDIWTLELDGELNQDHVNGGTNHFGSPFNFPEEFTTVYRLHPLVPDLLEFRERSAPNEIRLKIPALEGFRQGASALIREKGLDNWAISLGRQRLGALTLNNHGRFLQNLPMPRLGTETNKVDVAALDIIRDRERGVPRFNEFRRQYGLQQLTSFDDFVDPSLPAGSTERSTQEARAKALREVYGTHVCDESKVISHAQRRDGGPFPNDCLGRGNGTVVDNVEDIDTVVGWLAEPVRPHGYAISETQFVVFILNASRRLFSDRFFTSSFRPEFYTTLGHEWVTNNGPGAPEMEVGEPNGHQQPVSPMKRILLRTAPGLREELQHVVNVFDPWARDRGEYYSVEWTPRESARDDSSFAK